MNRALLLEIDVKSPAGVDATLRFSDRAVRPFPPTDPDRADDAWDDRLVEPPSLRRALFSDLTTLTPDLGLGAISLANADRALDIYQGHAFGEVRLWRWTEGTPFSAAIEIMTGRCGTAGFGLSSTRPGRVQVQLFDCRLELEKPLQTSVYGGLNGVAGELYDGAPDGLKGKVKPLAYGDLTDAHLPAPMVNGAILAHQLHDGAVSGTEAIFDRGDAAGFVDDGDASGGVFDAATPAAAHYRTDHGRGLLKINGDPAGTLTFGIKGSSAGGYVETAGPVVARLLTKAGIAGGRIDASVAAFANAAVIGAWFGATITAREAIGWVARSALMAVLPNRLGVWEARALAPPAAIADHTIAADEIVSIDADVTAPAPVGEIKVGWGKIWQTFRGGDLAPAIRESATATRLSTEYRYAVVVDAAAKAQNPTSWQTLSITTALRTEAAALTLAASLKTLFGLRADGRPRRSWRVVVEMTDAALALPLGSTVALDYPAGGIDDLYLLIGEEPMTPSRDLIAWTLWG